MIHKSQQPWGLPRWVAWPLAAAIGLGLGWLLTHLAPAGAIAGEPVIPLWLLAPFVLLLASIAAMPFISARFWHAHYPEFSLLLGGVTAGYYLAGYTMPASPPAHNLSYGQEHMLHSLIEYYQFIALIGGLYVVS